MSAPAATAALQSFKITLRRSVIGTPKGTRDTIRALGLRHTNHTVLRTATPSISGMIMKCKEMLEVEVVPHTNTEQYNQYRANRTEFNHKRRLGLDVDSALGHLNQPMSVNRRRALKGLGPRPHHEPKAPFVHKEFQSHMYLRDPEDVKNASTYSVADLFEQDAGDSMALTTTSSR
ncbi:hypothetical protein H696_00206 [Fonticula alba]|uniref:Large ribosomal subunit protein uL30m n=1 Tax=Fonticula alba TaxID=691883 RepID=A0A058ZGJ8_FONAL|nr:hypothetical protein H696_00206 [Fonticula alba]KCV72622.1 hypothetical protein H696_00206 [Fonticula alba]|eukprot:XP_009492323.1 hypothetical protein H696_00206 [Fonticula alba]